MTAPGKDRPLAQEIQVQLVSKSSRRFIDNAAAAAVARLRRPGPSEHARDLQERAGTRR